MISNWLHRFILITVGTLCQNAQKRACFIQSKDRHLYIQLERQHLITAASLICHFPTQILLREPTVSSSPSRGSLSGLWITTHVVNLCLWSGWRTASGQMLRQCSRWPRRIRRRNMPIRLFRPAIFPSRSRPVGPLPVGGEAVGGWEGSPEPQQLPGASAEPSEAL